MSQKIHARRPLGRSGVSVRAVGLGLMGMSQFYGTTEDAVSLRTIREAIDLGVDFFDTSDFYGASSSEIGAPVPGFGHNESLLGRALEGRRGEVVVATKFSARPTGDGTSVFDGRPEYVSSAIEASLRRLRTDYIDVYYYHRLDPTVPIEDTVGAMADLVATGKVRAIGLSEIDADTLRRAVTVHPVAVLQSEYSLWERSIETEVIAAARQHDVTLVPYSPLGRGMLAGAFGPTTVFDRSDFRSTLPRFQGEHMARNLALVEGLSRFARERDATPGQVALAWLLAQPHDIVPIPGSRSLPRITENLAASTVRLSADDIAMLSTMFDPARISGERYGTRHPPRETDQSKARSE
ncbi:aldo/keto reductase [Microbacterium sp. LWH10-1.2]|uniref:aldo/keto reductase n=1 Tax=Microbacterium sp. LWH10-1.2 TaxID=3135255 RepID=UPI003138AAEC